jgi:MFS family permease
LIIWFTGKITVELGGKKFAIALACLALTFSPAFLASGYLFQPVVFDQFWWVLTVWLLLRYINTQAIKYLYFIGMAIGFGILTKYTMLFFAAALLLGLATSKQRRLLLCKHVSGAIGVALLIALPNIIWQFMHHWPVFNHMAELKERQLDYVKTSEFILQQFMVNGVAVFVWLVGLLFLVLSFKLRKYQSLAFGFILIFIFLMQMNGKVYYLFGAYPMLFAAGGYGFERLLKSSMAVRGTLLALFTLPNLIMLPAVLPVFPVKTTLAFFDYINKNVGFISFITRWEDQKQHATSQDYGDMFGWDELTEKVARVYNGLTPDQKRNTQIFTDNYGQAGALHHLGKQYNLPQVISLNSSFSLWAPPDLNARYLIYVDDDNGENVKRLAPFAESCKKMEEIKHPLAVELGTTVMLLTNPRPGLNAIYQKELAKRRGK